MQRFARLSVKQQTAANDKRIFPHLALLRKSQKSFSRGYFFPHPVYMLIRAAFFSDKKEYIISDLK